MELTAMHGTTEPDPRRRAFLAWAVFATLVVLIKAFVFALDHQPMFFMFDSWTYISSAINGVPPVDRSFTYGWLIRAAGLAPRSLVGFIAFQSLLGAFCAVALAYILRRQLGVRPTVAFSLGLLAAAEPIQLMLERYVMTDVAALAALAFYALASFRYVQRPRIATLVVAQLLAIALVSLRLSYLPAVAIAALALPVTALIGREGMRARAVLTHGVVSFAVFALSLSGYKHLNGRLSDRPPALHYGTGLFLVTAWGPVVEPEDLPRADLREAVFGRLRYDMKDRATRLHQHWHKGGFCRNLRIAVRDELEAERLARQTAMNALRRDPLGVARLAAASYFDNFNIPLMRKWMFWERGDDVLPPEFLAVLEEKFGYRCDSTPGQLIPTLTGSLFMRAWPWHCVLMLLPFFALLAVRVSRGVARRICVMLLLYSSALIATVVLLSEMPVVRFALPLAWMAFLIAGVLIEAARRLPSHNTNGFHHEGTDNRRDSEIAPT